MKRNYIFLLSLVFLSSCDCMQHASGVVLDKDTKKPLSKVALGKFEKEDLNNSYSRRESTDTTGQFDYESISGGPFGCPGLKLYFSREGYITTKFNFDCTSRNDTVLLEKSNRE